MITQAQSDHLPASIESPEPAYLGLQLQGNHTLLIPCTLNREDHKL